MSSYLIFSRLVKLARGTDNFTRKTDDPVLERDLWVGDEAFVQSVGVRESLSISIASLFRVD